MAALVSIEVVLFGAVAQRGSILLRPRHFLALPVVAFTMQEHLERLNAGHGSVMTVWQEPTFWRGLVLQVPFAALAFAIAALLLRVVVVLERLGRRRRARVQRIAGTVLRRPGSAPQVVLVPCIRGGDSLRFRGPPGAVRGRL
jgi:hypothetical protein